MAKRRRFQLRLLPVAIFTLVLMLGLRLGNIWTGLNGAGVTPSLAQQAAPSAKAPPAVMSAKAAEKAPEKGNAKGAPAKAARTDGLPDDPALFSQSEIDLLQKLADRRAKLDKWAQELDMREGLLKAAEQRIDRKVGELRQIQAKLKGMLRQYDQEQENKLKSLVKIYETMKPKDAARIFMQLDMPVLLDVIERMNERKSAAILANMSPEKAKNITDELVARRKIGEEAHRKLPSASAGSSAVPNAGPNANRGPLPSSGSPPGKG